MATAMKELCKNLNIKQNISTAYHLQTDGQSERTNQWLEQYLRIFGNGAQTDWSKWLPLAQYTHNAWPSATTSKSPFELIIGHVSYAHVGKTHSLVPTIDSRLAQTKAMRQTVQQVIMHAQQITIRATKYRPFKEGQKVWLVTTLQGRLITRLSEALERSSGMTLSCMNLVLSGCVRSVQQCKVIPFVA